MRPEIERILRDEPRILTVGLMDAKGGLWATWDRGSDDGFHLHPWHAVAQWVRYTTPGERGCKLMLLTDFLFWGLDGEFATQEVRR